MVLVSNIEGCYSGVVSVWEGTNKDKAYCFSIEHAQQGDETAISRVAREAYFHPKFASITCRDIAKKDTYPITGQAIIRKRLDNTDAYKVLVCKAHESAVNGAADTADASKVEKKIIGTVYYQPKNSDFRDEKGDEVAELGLMAVEPEFWGNQIGEKLIDAVFDLAVKDKMRAIYIYAIGSRTDDGKYSNKVLEFYEKKGFRYVSPWEATNDVYTTENKTINMVVMMRPMIEGSQPLSITSKKKGTIPVPCRL